MVIHTTFTKQRQLYITCTLTVDIGAKKTVVADGSGRVQVLTTVDDHRHLITLGVQHSSFVYSAMGVTASRDPSTLAATCYSVL